MQPYYGSQGSLLQTIPVYLLKYRFTLSDIQYPHVRTTSEGFIRSKEATISSEDQSPGIVSNSTNNSMSAVPINYNKTLYFSEGLFYWGYTQQVLFFWMGGHFIVP